MGRLTSYIVLGSRMKSGPYPHLAAEEAEARQLICRNRSEVLTPKSSARLSDPKACALCDPSCGKEHLQREGRRLWLLRVGGQAVDLPLDDTLSRAGRPELPAENNLNPTCCYLKLSWAYVVLCMLGTPDRRLIHAHFAVWRPTESAPHTRHACFQSSHHLY